MINPLDPEISKAMARRCRLPLTPVYRSAMASRPRTGGRLDDMTNPSSVKTALLDPGRLHLASLLHSPEALDLAQEEVLSREVDLERRQAQSAGKRIGLETAFSWRSLLIKRRDSRCYVGDQSRDEPFSLNRVTSFFGAMAR